MPHWSSRVKQYDYSKTKKVIKSQDSNPTRRKKIKAKQQKTFFVNKPYDVHSLLNWETLRLKKYIFDALCREWK